MKYKILAFYIVRQSDLYSPETHILYKYFIFKGLSIRDYIKMSAITLRGKASFIQQKHRCYKYSIFFYLRLNIKSQHVHFVVKRFLFHRFTAAPAMVHVK